MRIFREDDIEHPFPELGRVAIIGYGNQGHAHAMNLRDGGIDVVVGARKSGPGWSRAEADGFQPVGIPEAVGSADCVALLLPDEVQAAVFESEIRPSLKPASSLVFAHGFTITFGLVRPPEGHDVILIAPKGQGHYLRALYSKKLSLPCLIAVAGNASGRALEKALAYARMLGCLSAGAIQTSFREEAITDLFGEQVVLCGGVPALVKAAFETLVARGYRPEIAYLECLHELKIITDLMHREGIVSMREKISRTAAWGSYQTENEVVSKEVKKKMEDILGTIESGKFADGWRREAASGRKRLAEKIEQEARHPIETAGERVRELMPYLREGES
jgi:ketol-acid reductoisomerase